MAAVQRPNPNSPASFYAAVSSLCDAAIEAGSQISAMQASLSSEILTRGLTDAGEAQTRAAAVSDLYSSLDHVATNLYAALKSVGDNLTASINQHASDLEAEIAAKIGALQSALNSEAAERKSFDATLLNSVTAARLDLDTRSDASLLAVLSGGRPGIVPAAFRDAAIGQAASGLDPSGCLLTRLGLAYRISGTGIIAPRAVTPVDPDSIYVLRVRYWRLVDPVDPNNNAVEIGIQWVDEAGADLGKTRIRRDRDLLVQSGPRALTVRVPSVAGAIQALLPPKGAVAWRPYVRAYGSDGATAVGVLDVGDATFAGVYAPDLTDLSDRLGAAEGQLKVGFDNMLDRRILHRSTNPSTDDVPTDTVRICKNEGTGRMTIWANDGGTLVDLLSFSPVT